MKCPKCENKKTSVTITKNRQDGTIYRRRKCVRCGHRFSTTEYWCPWAEERRSKEWRGLYKR